MPRNLALGLTMVKSMGKGVDMLSKVFAKNSRYCRVTFYLPPDVHANTANLCGDFNNWSTRSHPMQRQPDGSFSLTLKLKFGQDYRFRYFIDGYCWFNDDAADGYVTNQHDNLDSIVRLNNGSGGSR